MTGRQRQRTLSNLMTDPLRKVFFLNNIKKSQVPTVRGLHSARSLACPHPTKLHNECKSFSSTPHKQIYERLVTT